MYNMGADIWICLYISLWHQWLPTYKLQQTYLIELERGKLLGIIVQNIEEISYKCTETRLHRHATDVNPGPFLVYVYENTTPQNPYYYLIYTHIYIHLYICVYILNNNKDFAELCFRIRKPKTAPDWRRWRADANEFPNIHTKFLYIHHNT